MEMHLVWKRMEKVIEELLRKDDLTIEDRLAAILLAMDAARLPHDSAQTEKIRKYLIEAVAARPERRKKL